MPPIKGTVGEPVPLTGRHSAPKQENDDRLLQLEQALRALVNGIPEEDINTHVTNLMSRAKEVLNHDRYEDRETLPQGYNPAPIDPMTDETPNINDHTWVDLFSYDFEVYPDDLVVTTTANPDEFAEAVTHEAILRHHGHGGSIETVLRNLGHAAVTGRRVDDDGRSV